MVLPSENELISLLDIPLQRLGQIDVVLGSTIPKRDLVLTSSIEQFSSSLRSLRHTRRCNTGYTVISTKLSIGIDQPISDTVDDWFGGLAAACVIREDKPRGESRELGANFLDV